MTETMSAILRKDLPDLSETNKTVSPALERVVRHCLKRILPNASKKTSGRYKGVTKIEEEIKNQEQAKQRSRLWISFANGLVLLVGLIALGGCSKNGASGSNTKPSSEVVKNGIGMEFASVPAGSFKMGLDSYSDESPVHQVAFPSGFHLGRYEVTQAQWLAYGAGYFRSILLADRHCWFLDRSAGFENSEGDRTLAALDCPGTAERSR